MKTASDPAGLTPSRHQQAKAGRSPKDNLILRQLGEAAYQRLLPHLQPVLLKKNTLLSEPGSSKPHVYFPIDAVVASQRHLADGSMIDASIIGCHGLLLAGPCCGVATDDSAVVRVTGMAYRLETPQFIDMIRHDEVTLMKFLSLSQIHHQKMAKQLACNQHHTARQRVAKLLLQFMDLVDSDTIACKHQEMADSLGVRREAVSLILKSLDQEGILQIQRGAVTVLDRQLLSACACECYGEWLPMRGH